VKRKPRSRCVALKPAWNTWHVFINHQPSSSLVKSLPAVEETGTPCNLVKPYSKAKRNQPREVDARWLISEFPHCFFFLRQTAWASCRSVQVHACTDALQCCVQGVSVQSTCSYSAVTTSATCPLREWGIRQGREHGLDVLGTYSPHVLDMERENSALQKKSKLC